MDSAIEALDFETRPLSKVAPTQPGKVDAFRRGRTLGRSGLLLALEDIAPGGPLEGSGHLPTCAAMNRKRLSLAVAGVVVAVVLAIGLAELPGGSTTPPSKLTLAEMRDRLQGAPAPLAALHAQAGELLPGGLSALRRRLAELRGVPVVINKWASWCEPCREEFGAFQRASLADGREVAFIGIDSGDPDRGHALAFLHSYPVSYPSYYDPSGSAGEAITDASTTPVTVFYNRSGGEFIHQGPYATAAKLEAAVRRYALAG